MSSNSLEHFIRQNRDDFDSDRPSLEVWAAISDQLEKNASQRRIPWLRYIAASALILVGVALGLLLYPSIQAFGQYHSESKQQDLEEIEYYFARQVAEQTSQLTGFIQASEERRDLVLIDEMIKNLKEELKDAPKSARDKLIQAIIVTYEAKVELFETIIYEKNKIEEIQYDQDAQI